MRQTRIIPRSLTRPDGSPVEVFAVEIRDADGWRRDPDRAFPSWSEAELWLRAEGHEVVASDG